MVVSINLYSLCFFILFTVAMFIGSIRLPIGPIRIDFVLSFVFLLCFILIKKSISKKIIRKAINFLLFIPYFIMIGFCNRSSWLIRDYLFVLIPIYSFIIYVTLNILVERINLKKINKLLNAYIIISFVVSIIQLFNIFNLNNLLNGYFTFLSINNASVDVMANLLTQRPFGFSGNPTFLTFLIYIIFKIKTQIKNEKLISFFAFSTMVISGGRMVMFFAILWECFEFIYKRLKRVKSSAHLLRFILTIIFAAIIFLLVMLAVVYYIPFLNQQIWTPIAEGRYFDNYSYTYRFSMYNLFLTTSPEIIIKGGYGYETFLRNGIKYVDSEYVMRVLQFGILGLFLLFYPLFKFAKEHHYNIYAVFPLALCLGIALTNFTITNYAFIFYIVLYLAVYKKLSEIPQIYICKRRS